jgi:hypothetical protein
MSSKSLAALGISVAAVFGVSARSAAPQTAYPGQMTQARVWIQNKGDGEAVPVDLRDVNVAVPLRVQVVNADPGHATMPPVQVRLTRPAWEYSSLVVPEREDVVRALTARGAEGWEVVWMAEVAGSTGPATRFLLKRLR